MARPRDVDDFLVSFPEMRLLPRRGGSLRLEGELAFRVALAEYDVSDAFALEIHVPREFPEDLPVVRERGVRLKSLPEPHQNPDGTLCLGSPVRLKLLQSRDSSLLKFVDKCLVPFLAAAALQTSHGVPWVFGELEHGTTGLLADYRELFDVETNEQALHCLRLLSMEKRKAMKRQCPCGCSRPLRYCTFHERFLEVRTSASRRWFGAQLAELGGK